MKSYNEASIHALIARLRNHALDSTVTKNEAAEAIIDLWEEIKHLAPTSLYYPRSSDVGTIKLPDGKVWAIAGPVARHIARLRQTVLSMKVQHQIDPEVYRDSGGGRMCINCGAQDYDEGPCDSEQIPENKMLDRVLAVIAKAGEA